MTPARRRWPLATAGLVLLELAVFAIALAASEQAWPAPDVLAAGWRHSQAIQAGQAWRLVSCLLLHAGWWHLALNLTALAHVGYVIERRWGPAVLVTWFVIGGLAGALAGWGSGYVSVGCSGALVALVAAALVGERRWDGALAGWLAVMMLGGFWLPNVDHLAHLGGAAAGMVMGLLAAPVSRRRRLRRSLAVLAGMATVAGAAPMTRAMWPLRDSVVRQPPGMSLALEVPRTWLRPIGAPDHTVYHAPGVRLLMEVRRLPEAAPADGARPRWLLRRHAGARLVGGPRRLGTGPAGEEWWLRVAAEVIEDEYVFCRADETILVTGMAEGQTIRRYAPVFGHAAQSLVVEAGGGE